MIIINKKYNMLLAIKETDVKKGGKKCYLFKCDCGNEKIIVGQNVLNEKTKFCGCFRKIKSCKNSKITHNMSNHKLYKVFSGMIKRCYNKNNKDYKNYGDKGVLIYNKWLEDRTLFFEWALQNGWKEGLTIERIEVNGNYEPNNCKFITMKEQAQNRRNSIPLNKKNEILRLYKEDNTIKDISKQMDLKYSSVYNIIKRNSVPLNKV